MIGASRSAICIAIKYLEAVQSGQKYGLHALFHGWFAHSIVGCVGLSRMVVWQQCIRISLGDTHLSQSPVLQTDKRELETHRRFAIAQGVILSKDECFV